VGANVQELVFRAIYSCRNAEFQMQALAMGKVSSLSAGEIERAGLLNSQPNVTSRTWEYWTMRLERSGNGLKQAAPASPGTIPATTKPAPKSKRSRR
jgi:HCOMODA/2-hydroxy-3-carboxy-muconic semialdehyde decarboxylase